MYKYILFDLDGTLTDPGEGITKSVQYALSRMGIIESDLKKLEPFIGPPLIESFQEYYGFSPEEVQEATVYFREYFTTKGLYQNKMFEGVPQMLQKLKDNGRVIAIASSKPEPFVRQILDNFALTSYFDYICGGTLDEKRCRKADVIGELLRQMNLPEEEKNKLLMVGDRRHDVEGAACFGIPCLGLALGFAAEGELWQAGAVEVAESIEAIADFVLRTE